jgi:hypothetical protein
MLQAAPDMQTGPLRSPADFLANAFRTQFLLYDFRVRMSHDMPFNKPAFSAAGSG